MKAMTGMLEHGLVPVILAAEQSGLLQELDRGGTVEELASRRGLHPRATRLVLDVLCGLHVCARDERGFYRRPDGFDRRMPWEQLPTFLATGEVLPMIDTPLRGEGYAVAVGTLGDRFAPWARALAARLPAAEAILDVGAGSGIWSLTMAERSSDAHVTAIDLSPVLPSFLDRAARLGLGGRVTALAGSYHELVPGSTFDRVVMANVLHLETPADAAALVARYAPLVAPGGDLVIVDCVGEGEEHEPSRSLYTLHLGMRTARGGVHSQAALRAWCEEASLADIEVVTLDVPAMGAMVARHSPRRGA